MVGKIVCSDGWKNCQLQEQVVQLRWILLRPFGAYSGYGGHGYGSDAGCSGYSYGYEAVGGAQGPQVGDSNYLQQLRQWLQQYDSKLHQAALHQVADRKKMPMDAFGLGIFRTTHSIL